MPTVHFPQSGLAVEVEPGITLLDAARRAGLELEAPCNGQGTCGKCRVTIDVAAAVRRRDGEPPARELLACLAEVREADVSAVFAPVVRGRDRVLTSGHRVARPLRPHVRQRHDPARAVHEVLHGDEVVAEGAAPARLLGIAVDIGTTTLVVSLLDLESGGELATVGAVNPQTRLGHDVLSRIQHASTPAGLEELQALLAAELDRMIAEVLRRAGARLADVHEVVLAGNTTMLHLAAGRDPRSLGRHPYTPLLRGGTLHPAADFRLTGGPHTRVYLPPVFDGFVGADISAGVLATALHERRGVTLFIDVGTNGEMVLAAGGRLVATSTAAGPAFEGMNITAGMRAAAGAIDQVVIGPRGVQARTIGSARARGVCGSGLLDAVAETVRTGLVESSGRFAPPERVPGHLAGALVPHRGKRALCLARDADTPEGVVVLTQQDVRQVQLAKGAIRAGVDALLARAGLEPDEVEQVLLAGSFGAHLDPASLVRIGMIPEALGGRVLAVGNTSRTGAEALLLDGAARAELAEIVRGAELVDLAHAPGFADAFVKAMAFPAAPRAAA